MSRVRDGADRRRERVWAMLSFIEMAGPDGAETIEVQAYMLERYGLKFQTTSEYLRECSLAGFVRLTTKGWVVTDRFRKFKGV